MRSAHTNLDKNFASEMEWLLFHLWAQPGVFRFKIADTVILRPTLNGIIHNWYFTAKEGHILKKNRSNLTARNIISKFANKLKANFQHVAATAYHYDYVEQGRDVVTLEHVATHDFSSFFEVIDFDSKQSSYHFRVPQVVQKFVYSKSSRN